MKQRTTLAGLMLGLAGLFQSGLALAINDMPGGPARFQMNLHPAATKVAEEVATLHWMMLIICTVIFVAVFGVMFYSIYKHRKSLGHQSASFHESTTVEIKIGRAHV